MSEPKFKRGQTVTILSRNPLDNNRWENNNVGGNAIIERASDSSTESYGEDYESEIVYSLWLLFENGKRNRICSWFEEKYLELYCSNEERGLKILKDKEENRR